MATGRVPTTANSPLTAKGDLFGYSTTQARVAVGNNGETLVADSSASVGLRYSATPSASNPVLNSAFQVWQRGTSIASGAAQPYTADRWQVGRAGAVAGTTVSRQATGDTTNLPNIQYCARVQRDSGNTSTAATFFMQSFETFNAIPYAGKTIALSFYARAGANYSAASSSLVARIDTGTGTDQNVFSGYTGSATPISQGVTLTTTWQRFTVTGTIASTATELGLLFQFNPTGTAGANDYYEVTGVQIDIGSVALPFRTYAATIQGELAACQRYYYRTTSIGSSTDNILPLGMGISTTEVQTMGNFPVRMRTFPTAVEWAGLRTYDGTTFVTVTAITLGTSTLDGFLLSLAGASGMVQYRPTQTRSTSSSPANSYVGFSAEL